MINNIWCISGPEKNMWKPEKEKICEAKQNTHRISRDE